MARDTIGPYGKGSERRALELCFDSSPSPPPRPSDRRKFPPIPPPEPCHQQNGLEMWYTQVVIPDTCETCPELSIEHAGRRVAAREAPAHPRNLVAVVAHGVNAAECTICLEPDAPGMLALRCGHAFCASCLGSMHRLGANVPCPICSVGTDLAEAVPVLQPEAPVHRPQECGNVTLVKCATCEDDDNSVLGYPVVYCANNNGQLQPSELLSHRWPFTASVHRRLAAWVAAAADAAAELVPAHLARAHRLLRLPPAPLPPAPRPGAPLREFYCAEGTDERMLPSPDMFDLLQSMLGAPARVPGRWVGLAAEGPAWEYSAMKFTRFMAPHEHVRWVYVSSEGWPAEAQAAAAALCVVGTDADEYDDYDDYEVGNVDYMRPCSPGESFDDELDMDEATLIELAGGIENLPQSAFLPNGEIDMGFIVRLLSGE